MKPLKSTASVQLLNYYVCTRLVNVLRFYLKNTNVIVNSTSLTVITYSPSFLRLYSRPVSISGNDNPLTLHYCSISASRNGNSAMINLLACVFLATEMPLPSRVSSYKWMSLIGNRSL